MVGVVLRNSLQRWRSLPSFLISSSSPVCLSAVWYYGLDRVEAVGDVVAVSMGLQWWHLVSRLCVPVAVYFCARLPLCELVVGLGVQEEVSHIVLVATSKCGCNPEGGGAWSALVVSRVVVLLRWVLVVYPGLAVAAARMSEKLWQRLLQALYAPGGCFVELVVRCGSRCWAPRSLRSVLVPCLGLLVALWESVLRSCVVARPHTTRLVALGLWFWLSGGSGTLLFALLQLSRLLLLLRLGLGGFGPCHDLSKAASLSKSSCSATAPVFPDATDVEAGLCGIGSGEGAAVMELLEVVELLSLLAGGSDGLGGCAVVAFCLVSLFVGLCCVCSAGSTGVLVVGLVGVLLVDRADGEGAGVVAGVFIRFVSGGGGRGLCAWFPGRVLVFVVELAVEGLFCECTVIELVGGLPADRSVDEEGKVAESGFRSGLASPL